MFLIRIKNIFKKLLSNFLLKLIKNLNNYFLKYKFLKNKLLILFYKLFSFLNKFFKSNTNRSEVPKVLFTSYCCEKNEVLVTSILNNWSNINKDFAIKYFSDKDLEIFFQKHQQYQDTFEKLRNGVAKADFFRLVYMHEYGGYWFDFDLKPFRVLTPERGRIHLFDMGYRNISYMFKGGIPNKLFEETLKKVSSNIDRSYPIKKEHIIDITGPKVIQKILSEKLGFNLIDGKFKGKLNSKTFLQNTPYEFEYMCQLNMQLKSKIYQELQKKYKKKNYYEYDYI